jgi:plasmid replication initiation protein
MIQSYLVTAARYDFSVYEKRILYRLVEIHQCLLEGKKLNDNYRIDNMLYEGMKEVTMPIAAFLKDEIDENYNRAKDALWNLNKKTMEYEDTERIKLIRIIELPEVIKKGYVKFVLHKEIFDALQDFSQGFRRIELKTAMEFDTVYAMRFYELFSGKKDPITYSIDNLKIMFQLEKKYKETKDFIRRVVEPAQKELAEKAPFSFTYSPQCIRKKIISLTFFPYTIISNVDQDIESKVLEKRTALTWDLNKMTIDYLKQNYLFETDEIKHNRSLFKEAEGKLDLMSILANKRRYCYERKSPKGTLITILKRELAKLEKLDKRKE